MLDVTAALDVTTLAEEVCARSALVVLLVALALVLPEPPQPAIAAPAASSAQAPARARLADRPGRRPRSGRTTPEPPPGSLRVRAAPILIGRE
ncbi:MAG TPA: hypothetical protein VKU89_08495 [Solirubrobacteraceae bacterium]|nr:hypothetical protein [Solirubrobacteraceae bacterium]